MITHAAENFIWIYSVSKVTDVSVHKCQDEPYLSPKRRPCSPLHLPPKAKNSAKVVHCRPESFPVLLKCQTWNASADCSPCMVILFFVELHFNIIVNSPIHQPSQQTWYFCLYNLVHTVFPASYVYVSIWFLNYLMQRQIEGKISMCDDKIIAGGLEIF